MEKTKNIIHYSLCYLIVMCGVILPLPPFFLWYISKKSYKNFHELEISKARTLMLLLTGMYFIGLFCHVIFHYIKMDFFEIPLYLIPSYMIYGIQVTLFVYVVIFVIKDILFFITKNKILNN